MKPSYRYSILLLAGIANIGLGLYAYAHFVSRIVHGITEIEVGFVGAGFVAMLVGIFLVYRMLPPLLRIRRGEPMRHILHRAGFVAFSFLVVALLILVSVTLALLNWDLRLTWMQLVPMILGVWIASLAIFAGAVVYLYTK
jgi:hypothetical protein